jgi:hypothetical protein
MKKSIRRLTILIFIVLFLGACEKTPDEEQIAQNIASMKEAVELKDFTGVKKHLHKDFIANERLHAREVNQLLQMYSMQHRNIGVTIIASETTMDSIFSDRAETTMSVVVTGASGRFPSDGSVRTVKLVWVKQSGDWLVRKAKWEQY